MMGDEGECNSQNVPQNSPQWLHPKEDTHSLARTRTQFGELRAGDLRCAQPPAAQISSTKVLSPSSHQSSIGIICTSLSHFLFCAAQHWGLIKTAAVIREREKAKTHDTVFCCGTVRLYNDTSSSVLWQLNSKPWVRLENAATWNPKNGQIGHNTGSSLLRSAVYCPYSRNILLGMRVQR